MGNYECFSGYGRPFHDGNPYNNGYSNLQKGAEKCFQYVRLMMFSPPFPGVQFVYLCGGFYAVRVIFMGRTMVFTTESWVKLRPYLTVVKDTLW